MVFFANLLIIGGSNVSYLSGKTYSKFFNKSDPT